MSPIPLPDFLSQAESLHIMCAHAFGSIFGAIGVVGMVIILIDGGNKIGNRWIYGSLFLGGMSLVFGIYVWATIVLGVIGWFAIVSIYSLIHGYDEENKS